MSDFEAEKEPRDYTKLIWGGIAVLFLGMIAAVFLSDRPDTTKSLVRAKHILIMYKPGDPADRGRALERVNQLRDRLLKGEDFGKLAKEYSDDPGSAARGGDLGWAPRNTYDKAFDEYCWTAPVGQLSEIVTSAYGFHLIMVAERNLSKTDAYEQTLEEKAKELLKQSTPGTPLPSEVPPAAPAASLPAAQPVLSPSVPAAETLETPAPPADE